MEMTIAMGWGFVIGIVPIVGWVLWWWNEIRYAVPASFRCSRGGAKLPPGSMGFPIIGDLLTFLWYFKFLKRPDHYIDSMRRRYGDGEGLYKTYLFGSPAIIACSPLAAKFVLQSSEEKFFLEWPSKEIVGNSSLVAVHGAAHTRIRSFVVKSINQPDALKRIALMVQPRIITALHSWSQRGRIQVLKQVKKVTFENIGNYFAGFEPGPVLDNLDKLFIGMVNGVRAHPTNIPGTAFHHALQCRKKANAVFEEEMEKRKKEDGQASTRNDLLDGLMRLKDDEGKQLCDQEILDNIVSLVVAGYESTSTAIMWAFYHLAKNPHVLQKLREEHLTLNKKNGDFITSEEISRLTYTNKVVEEIIRMANVAALIFRTAKTDVDYKGYRIPKGWKVICLVRYIHTNPENFENPNCFNPDRWNVPPRPGTYLVFGGGARTCAGNMLARLQVSIFLHHMVLGYRWELINPEARMSYLPNPKPVDGVEISISII